MKPATAAIVGEPIWMLTDRHLPEKPLVRAAEDGDAGGAPIAREEEIVLLVDEDPGDAGQLMRERAHELACLAVDHVDPVGPGVGDVHPPAGAVHVSVVEPRSRPARDLDEIGADEAHAAASPPPPPPCTRRRARRRPAGSARAGGGRRDRACRSPQPPRAGRATAASRRDPSAMSAPCTIRASSFTAGSSIS